MESTRKLLFYIFLVLYLILCPLLILYSLGYIFNPQNKEIVQTGVIYLSSLPSDADIFLEKSHYIHATPSMIEELLPGDYTITLKSEGYKDWVENVTVEAGKAISFNNILLIPEEKAGCL